MAQRIDALIAQVVTKAKEQHGLLADLQHAWRLLVGKEAAAHSRPVSLRGERLVVHVDGPGDGFLLSYEKARLLKRLGTKTKGRVKEIVLRAGEL